MLANETTVVAVSHHIATDVGGEVVILDLNSGTYYGLEATGAYIWSLLEKPHTVQEITDIVLRQYDVDRETCEQDVKALLGELVAQKLVEIVSPN